MAALKKPLYMIVTAIAIGLSSCSLEEMQAQQAVRERLKDPGSGRFGKMIRIDKDSACLTVNAKNEMGGYTGNQYAAIMKIDGKWNVFSVTEFLENCEFALKSMKEEYKKYKESSK